MGGISENHRQPPQGHCAERQLFMASTPLKYRPLFFWEQQAGMKFRRNSDMAWKKPASINDL
jgi:hypothetical protein